MLRKRNQRSRANEWLNAALKLNLDNKDLLFYAELMTEIGLSLFSAGHVGDAIRALENAESRWRELSELAIEVCDNEELKLPAPLAVSIVAYVVGYGIYRGQLRSIEQDSKRGC